MIQDLEILQNTTSTVAVLSWQIVTDGGYAPLVFTVFYRKGREDFKLHSDNIVQYHDMEIIYNAKELQPETAYDFKVRAKSNRPIDAFSGNISNSGHTAGLFTSGMQSMILLCPYLFPMRFVMLFCQCA